MADIGFATASLLYTPASDYTTTHGTALEPRTLGYDPQLGIWNHIIFAPCEEPSNAWEGGVLP